jgi:hypothetical protein
MFFEGESFSWWKNLCPRNVNPCVADCYLEKLERLGRRSAYIGAGVGVIDAAMA